MSNTNCNRYKLLNYCINYKNNEVQETEKLFESSFERDIYYLLQAKGFKLIPQFKVGNYRLDFIVENNSNKKIVIECDGDSYHGIDKLEYDLERCGWKFIRIRASEFYYNKEKTTQTIIDEINNYLNNNIAIINKNDYYYNIINIDNSIDEESQINVDQYFVNLFSDDTHKDTQNNNSIDK